MDYVYLHSKYFKDFIDNDRYHTMKEYVDDNRKDKVWGDNIEIQAIAELYDIRIEIYEYTLEPTKVINYDSTSRQFILRLSYHNSVHYNAMVPVQNGPN